MHVAISQHCTQPIHAIRFIVLLVDETSLEVMPFHVVFNLIDDVCIQHLKHVTFMISNLIIHQHGLCLLINKLNSLHMTNATLQVQTSKYIDYLLLDSAFNLHLVYTKFHTQKGRRQKWDLKTQSYAIMQIISSIQCIPVLVK